MNSILKKEAGYPGSLRKGALPAYEYKSKYGSSPRGEATRSLRKKPISGSPNNLPSVPRSNLASINRSPNLRGNDSANSNNFISNRNSKFCKYDEYQNQGFI